MNAPLKPRQKLILKSIYAGISILLVTVFALIEALVSFDRLLPAYALPEREEGEARLHFVDVGQGDCTIVEFPSGDVLVVDAGDGTFASVNHLVRYLKGISPRTLEFLATHADSDHIGGFSALFRAFDAETLYLPLCASDNKDYARMLRCAEEANLPAKTVFRYQTLVREGGYAVCLSPYSEEEETDDNETSTVLYLDLLGVTAVLSGDIPEQRERLLTAEYGLDETMFDSKGLSVRLDGVDVLKAAHHGSDSSSCAEWLGLLRPSLFVLPCGRDNGYKHPNEGPMARYQSIVPDGRICRLDETGDVIVSIKNGTYTVITDWE